MLTKLRSITREVVPVHFDGNVSIDPSAAIAPGVLLQAEPDSRITIGAGVCIGAGTVVHASGGNLDICMGVCIGRGVLLLGSGTIERNACIGAGTTAIDPQIAEGEAIPTHSLLGDRSRGAVCVVEESTVTEPTPIAQVADRQEPDVWDTSDAWNTPAVAPPPTVEQAQSDEVAVEIEHRSHRPVSGRENFERLKRQLFANGRAND
jgi:carbon dioxide concentrating mechanism protein CcmN